MATISVVATLQGGVSMEFQTLMSADCWMAAHKATGTVICGDLAVQYLRGKRLTRKRN